MRVAADRIGVCDDGAEAVRARERKAARKKPRLAVRGDSIEQDEPPELDALELGQRQRGVECRL